MSVGGGEQDRSVGGKKFKNWDVCSALQGVSQAAAGGTIPVLHRPRGHFMPVSVTRRKGQQTFLQWLILFVSHETASGLSGEERELSCAFPLFRSAAAQPRTATPAVVLRGHVGHHPSSRTGSFAEALPLQTPDETPGVLKPV